MRQEIAALLGMRNILKQRFGGFCQPAVFIAGAYPAKIPTGGIRDKFIGGGSMAAA